VSSSNALSGRFWSQEKVAREKLEEANRKDKMHIHQSHEESKND